MSMVRIPIVLMLMLITLVSCGQPRGVMDSIEEHSDTGETAVFGTNLRVHHAALLDTSGIHLDFRNCSPRGSGGPPLPGCSGERRYVSSA